MPISENERSMVTITKERYDFHIAEIERLRGKIKKLERELDKKDANADMQYINGMKFGWNCGLYENNETYETVKKSILLQIRHWKQHSKDALAKATGGE